MPKIPFISTEKIIQDWKKKQFKPIYWFEGEEGYYIDQLMDYAEHHLLTPEESAFNLVVFYGKDAVWSEVINACRRYPMFAERQVVLLKEAQQMKDIDKLEPYIDQPLSSTIFVVGHKEKKLDGRGSMSKTLKKKGEVLTTKKLYDNQLPEWTSQLVHHKGFLIDPKALYLLVDHIGNDLSRISNEVDKLIVNLGKSREIKEEDIEKYIGVSREFNVFELQNAIAKREMTKAVRIIRYFEDNPKAGPIQMVLPAIHGFFSKAYMMFSLPQNDEKSTAAALGISPFFIKDYQLAVKNYSLEGVESILLLLHEYNLRSIGVNDSGTEDASLLKEMVVKMMDQRN